MGWITLRNDFNNWMKFRVFELILFMENAPFEWFLAGGHALDEFVKYRIREHKDIDILIDIKNVDEVLDYFKGYQIYIARNGKLIDVDEVDIVITDSLWIAEDKASPFFLEVLFFESDYGEWIYKRNRDIRRFIDSIYFISNGIRVIQPEIQLLYKMNSSNVRDKDLLDYEVVYAKLSDDQREWLDTKIK
ncbi:nucleotidyltransferase domain-containing protein [Macrococcus animalis]|uniref:nucleotidyltransferase domain-containing protein n=1 Tax=Macrococcus animalis TaxID=3395467 RepID=UPI0039BE8F04